MQFLKNILLYIAIFKAYILTLIILIINFSIIYVFADFESPHIDSYAMDVIKNWLNSDISFSDDESQWNLNSDNKVQSIKHNNVSIFPKITTIWNLSWVLNENETKVHSLKSWFIKSIAINIPKIGVYQKTFLMWIGDLKTATEEKSDKDIIDMELNDFFDIDSGFFIWGHSSWYWWDNSDKREIFKDIERLNIWDSIYLEINSVKGKTIRKFTVADRKIWKDLQVKKTDKIIYTCWPTNTSRERLVIFLK